MAEPARPLVSWRPSRLALMAALSLAAAPALANQGLISRDGTLGSATAPLAVGEGTDPLGQHADYLLSADLGEQHGTNLFHSFARFGIAAGEIATFTEQNALGPIDNVISRVTGGAASQLDGTLRSTIPGADVWLINPSGLVFGSGAQLDVPASFHAATADSLAFDDAGLGRFYADSSKTSVLSIARPSAFGFLGSAAGGAPSLRVDGGTLGVPAGQTLTLASHDGLALNGARLTAENGRVNLAAVSSAGDLTLADASAADPLDAASFATLGDITLAQSSTADVGGSAPGSVFIRGGRVVVENSSVLAENRGAGAGGRIDVTARGSLDLDSGLLYVTSLVGAPGTIGIRTGSMKMVNGGGVHSMCLGCTSLRAGRPTDAGLVRIDAADLTIDGANGKVIAGTDGTGDAGRLAITVSGALQLTGGAQLWAGTNASGQGGDVQLRAGSIQIADEHSGIFTTAFKDQFGNIASGNAGSIAIDSGDLTLSAGGAINAATFGPGNAGSIAINAGAVRMSGGGAINAVSTGAGNAGAVRLAVDSLSVSGGSSILTTSSGGGGGTSGVIDVHASQSILLDHEDGEPFSLLGLVNGTAKPLTGIVSGNIGGAGGGSVSLDAEDITVTRGARVGTSTIGGGDAGTVFLHANNIHVADGGVVSSASFVNPLTGLAGGAAGSVTLAADDSIEIVGGQPQFHTVSRVSSETLGSGAPGNVSLSAPHILVDGGAVATTALAYKDGREGLGGGNILIQSSGDVSVRHGGRIDASSFIAGDGGDIEVDATDSIEVDGANSEISARAGLDPEDVHGILSFLFDDKDNNGDKFVLVGIPALAGNAGSIRLDANEVRVSGAAIATDAETADGGNITIVARDLVNLSNGEITASVNDGVGGNITIDPHVVIVGSGSQIVTRANGGSGGVIRIEADKFLRLSSAVISADADSTKLGVPGTVEIHAPDVDLDVPLTTLPASVVDVSSLLRERCAARRAGGSSFTVRGAGGVAAEPDGALTANALAFAGGESAGAKRDSVALAFPFAAELLGTRTSCY